MERVYGRNHWHQCRYERCIIIGSNYFQASRHIMFVNYSWSSLLSFLRAALTSSGKFVLTTLLRTVPPGSNKLFFQVLYANTLHAYFTLIVVAYPSTSLSLGTLLLSYGTSFIIYITFISILPICIFRNSHRCMDFKRCRFSGWRRGSSPYISFDRRNVCYCEQVCVY